MNVKIYWWNRIKLLEAIKRDGDKLPFSILTRDIFSPGYPLAKITKEFEDSGFIIKERNDRRVKTWITPKGEELLRILKELKDIFKE